MQLHHFRLSISNLAFMLMLSLVCLFSTSANALQAWIVTALADGTYKVDKGPDFDAWAAVAQPPNVTWDGCGVGDTYSLIVSAGNEWGLFDVAGDAAGNCFLGIAKKLPFIVTDFLALPYFKDPNAKICVGRGKQNVASWDHITACDGEVEHIIEDVVCSISSGDIVHDYGTLDVAEVNGKTITTTSTVECTHATINDAVSTVSLSLNNVTNNKLKLRDDDSLNAVMDLNGKGSSTTLAVPINQPVNFSVKSTLEASPDVEGGEFKGSTLLVMTYN